MAKKKTTTNANAKAVKAPRTKKTSGRMGILEAAAKVLAEAGGPLGCKPMVETMLAKKYWTTNGKTPVATLYSAILREIQTKGKESRFKKTDRGRFALVSTK